MKYLKLLVVIFLTYSTPSFANDQNDERLMHLAKVSGIYAQLEEQKVAYSKSGANAAQQYLNQIYSTTPSLPKEMKDYLESEFKLYMSKIGDSMDIEFAVRSYIKLIGSKLTSRDIEQIIRFQESEVGRKFAQANTAIMGDWSNEISTDMRSKIQSHLKVFTQNIMEKAADYKQKGITKK